MNVSTSKPARAAALLRLGWGGLLLGDAGRLLVSFGERPTRGPVAVGRVLGARQVAQGAVTACAPASAVLVAGAAADTLHAMTAVGLAVASRRWRTVALADGAIAGSLAATGWWFAYRAHRRR